MPVFDTSSKAIQQQLVKSRWISLLMPMAVIGLILFALMALLMVLSYHALEDFAEREVEERMLESASQMANQLSRELQQLEYLGGVLADQASITLSNPNAYAEPKLLAGLQQSVNGVTFSPDSKQAAIFLVSDNNQGKTEKQQRLKQLTALSPLLKNVYNSHSLMSSAYIITHDPSKVVFPWLDVLDFSSALIDVKKLEQYDSAGKGNNDKNKTIWSSSYFNASNGSSFFTLNHPVVQQDKLIGVVGIDISLKALQERMAKMLVPWGGYSLLINAEGKLLVFPHQAEADWKGITARDLQADFNSEKTNLITPLPFRNHLEPLRSDTSGLVMLKLNEHDLLLSWSSVTPTGWKLLNIAEYDKVFLVKNKLIADYRLMLWLGGSFLSVMFLLLVFFVIRRDQKLSLFSQATLLEKHEQQPVITNPVINETDFMDLVAGPLIVCQFDKKGLVTACNSAFEHLAGSTQNKLKGTLLVDLLGLKNLFFDHQTHEIDLRIGQQKPSNYWVSLHYTADGKGLLLLLDVSNCKQIQQQLRGERQRTRLAEKMKAQFFKVAVSNANTLLVDLLQNARGFDANLTNYCQSKLIEVQHLLDDMRDMSDTGEAEQQELAEDTLVLSTLVNDCCAASESLLANSGRRLLVEYGANIPEYLVLDRRRLFRLMRHLLRQLIQLSGTGDIFLWLGWSELGLLQLKMHDQGGGLAESERLRRFQLTTPMSSSYESASGALGLGQLLTRQLVHEMRGSLEVEVLATGGLQLQIDLPARLSDQPKLLTLGRVLVVDDGPVNAILASSVLEKSGYLVDVANSGAKALELGLTIEYDLVLMDIFMPDMDGIQTTRQWRQLSNANAKVPVIALTANAMEMDRERFLQEGMSDYLTKPYRPNELREMIQRWLQKK